METWLSAAALLAVATVVGCLAVDTVRFGIPPTPTSAAARALCLQHMQKLPHAHVADLGAGFGGMARSMAHALPQARVWAIEASGWTFGLARLLGRRAPNVHWQRANFMHVSLHACDGVFCYLYRGIMPNLAAKLRDELKPGAWVVSVAFALPDWAPQQVLQVGDAQRTPVYVYRR